MVNVNIIEHLICHYVELMIKKSTRFKNASSVALQKFTLDKWRL